MPLGVNRPDEVSFERFSCKSRKGIPVGHSLIMWAMHNAPRYMLTWDKFLELRGYADIVAQYAALRGKRSQERLERLKMASEALAVATTFREHQEAMRDYLESARVANLAAAS